MPSLDSYYVLSSTHDGNQNGHTGDLVEHAGLFMHKVAYSRYDVLTEMFMTKFTSVHEFRMAR
jgi:hypothetical protein